MKKILLCFVIVFGLCACSKNIAKNKEQTEINEEIEKIDYITEGNQNDKEENKQENTPASKVEPKPNNSINEPEINKKPSETKKESNKKVVICTIKQDGSHYYGTVTQTTTFENDTLTYHTMYIEKAFNDDFKAEDDKAFEGVTNEKLNSLNDGRSGTIYIKNNTIYYTLNFDVKNHPNIISLVTTHTEYNDFLNHMTKNNGYSCQVK